MTTAARNTKSGSSKRKRKAVRVRIHDGSLWLEFDYDANLMTKIRNQIPGVRFVGKDKGGPAFRGALDLQTCVVIRQVLGDQVGFHPDLIAWGSKMKAEHDRITKITMAKDAVLERVPEELPLMAELMRPDQRAGVKFIAECAHPYVCDQQGLGKTWEIIGGLFECGLAQSGPNLVIAPKVALDNVWLEELNRFQDYPVFVADEGRRAREQLMEEIELALAMEQPFWVVVNPAMLTLRDVGADPNTYQRIFEQQYPYLYEVWWNSVTVDETHQAAMGNINSLTAKGIHQLNATKRIAASGTPVRGKPLKVWAVLHWLFPDEFKSKIRWGDTWCNSFDGYSGGKEYGGIIKGKEEDFWKAHAPYILRRTKLEVLPNLPPKQHFHLWAEMTQRQARQYLQMKNETEVKLDEMEQEGTLTATSVLALYTRLKQFADAYCEIKYNAKEPDHPFVIPTEDSGKLEIMMGLLNDLGITDEDYDTFPDDEKEQVVIFSQFSRVVDMVCKYLNDKGIPTAKITGATSRADRRDQKTEFQEGGNYRAMAMTTTAGGVSITLDRASTVIFLDETWVPDDQEQGEDRTHRASRIHQVNSYYIRSKGTIESYIQKRVKNKANINDTILDIYRQALEAAEDDAA